MISSYTVKMQFNPNAVRRIDVLTRILCGKQVRIATHSLRVYSDGKTVSIGDITREVEEPKHPEYVPRKYLNVEDQTTDGFPQSRLRHLRWMLQKDSLGQDMFLLGAPGPTRREVAMQFLELTQREVEYVALSRDTTEADLKQRREIQQGTAKYFDQSAVRAAVEGRVLVLEGIEKAERNVLPVLNNLLENREMHLEDGRFLIPADRYDKLLQLHGEEEVKKWRLERVGEGFRVIALGLPVPHYAGSSLDPPLRSRFQARHVPPLTYDEQLSFLTETTKAPPEKLKSLLSAAYSLSNADLAAASSIRIPDFPLDSLPRAAKILENNPNLPLHTVLSMLYPYTAFLTKDVYKNIIPVMEAFDARPYASENYTLNIKSVAPDTKTLRAQVTVDTDGFENTMEVPCGAVSPGGQIRDVYVRNKYQDKVLGELLHSHAVSDVCIIGPKGCGKSRVTSLLAHTLGYTPEVLSLYRDMPARELLQRRTTLPGGDTIWVPSPLVRAALAGRMLILDGLHRLHPSAGAVFQRLVHDREIQLYDGLRLIRHDRYDDLIASGYTEKQLTDTGVHRIHPAFRIVALAESPTLSHGPGWLSPEILSVFTFHNMRNLTKDEETFIIKSLFNEIPKPLSSIIDLAHILRTSNDTTLNNLSSSLSTRQLLRIANRMIKYSTDSAYDTVQRTFLAKFLPNLARNALDNVCNSIGINQETPSNRLFSKKDFVKELKCEVKDGVLTIGNTSVPIYKTAAITKVPDILFYNVPQHIELMEWLLQDFELGSHLLLVGNQGVGKNKIADRLLQLMNRPREYIQLHRDTTVQSLTVQPTVKDGMVLYEDSPLVNAVKYGHVLVVDEADKAPTHVTCILKTLVENGEMLLSDGRRIVPKSLIGTSAYQDAVLIPMHEDFRMIVLANRPGFPFLGNDFFAALGDLFSCHAVDNPSIESELSLLKHYGPDVPPEVANKLVRAFAVLRSMADQGLVTYPYSTREVVNIIKHIQKFPSDDLASAFNNVFDFDKYSIEIGETLVKVLNESGLPAAGLMKLKDPMAKNKLQMTINRKSGLDVSGPKHGKMDPKGNPHVGGNTWAGGTGGRDTAGLGGKGGPYRLDAGHPVHQLSEEEKDDIPEHIKKAAREMNRKAFEERLREIRMSEYDANLYNQFLDAVRTQVGALRGVLSSLQARAKERHWERHQTSGDLDDTKIIEGLTGEEAIYRRRMDQTPLPGTPQEKPKLLRLLVDMSGSMYRFNGFDGRLDRSLEAVVLVMEALRGFESRIKYDVWGHSGEEHNVKLVSVNNPPKNEKERLQVIRTMHAHSQFCMSGDTTVPAVKHAVQNLAEQLNTPDKQWDETMLVALSDANLSRYGIPPSKLANALTSNPEVQAHIVFIGSLGDQADHLLSNLPVGRAFICMEVSSLPQILQQIFAASISATPKES